MAADEQPDETRERLLQAAVEEFLENGYDGTKVTKVARRAGLTTGAIYYLWDSKSAMLSDAIIRFGSEEFRRFGGSVTAPDRGTANDSLSILTEVLVGSTAPHHRLLLEALAAAPRDANIDDVVQKNIELAERTTRAQLDRARGKGQLDDSLSADAWVFLVRTWVLGSFVTKALELDMPPEEDLRPVIERILRSISSDG